MTTVTDRRKGKVAADEALTLQQLASQHCSSCFDTGLDKLDAPCACDYYERQLRCLARKQVIELGQRPVEACTCGGPGHQSWCPAGVLPQFPATWRPAPRLLTALVALSHPWVQQFFRMAQQAANAPNTQVIINTDYVGNAHVGRDQFRRILTILQVPFGVNATGGITLENGSIIGYTAPEPFAEVLPC